MVFSYSGCLKSQKYHDVKIPHFTFRVTACIEAGQDGDIDPAVDDGQWFNKKIREQREQQQPNPDHNAIPVLPVTGWKQIGTHAIPRDFNYGNIYHHIVESVQRIMQAESDDSNDEIGMDLHTAKPLRKGKAFFTSGHVQHIQDKLKNNFYFMKCQVKASLTPNTMYDVTCTLSAASGFVVDASCTCKASSMGRCNHVCAMLYALLDYKNNFGSDPIACTSMDRSWNKGRSSKKTPNKVQDAKYNTYKPKKIDELYNFDPRPPSLQTPDPHTMINDFVYSLQISSKECPTMFETILSYKYEDYVLSEDQKAVLEVKCKYLVDNLKSNIDTGGHPFLIVKEQNTTEWHLQRRVRITASKVHRILHLSSKDAIMNFLLDTLWFEKSVNTKATQYGSDSESVACAQYRDDCRVIPGYSVITTGLWGSSQHPELACSPDGLVLDPRQNDTDKYGLLEIKCPFTLREHDVNDFQSVLTESQQKTFCLMKGPNGLRLKSNHPYYSQVQMQLGVMGLQWCDFVVWSAGGYTVDRIRFDCHLWSEMKRKLLHFHHTILCPELFEMKTVRGLGYNIA